MAKVQKYLDLEKQQYSAKIDAERVGAKYFKFLLDLRAQTQFLMADLKTVNQPSNDQDELTASMQYAKQCRKHRDALPLSKLILGSQVRQGLLALIDTHLNEDQLRAFTDSLASFHQDQNFEELCLVNNEMGDAQLSQLIQAAFA